MSVDGDFQRTIEAIGRRVSEVASDSMLPNNFQVDTFAEAERCVRLNSEYRDAQLWGHAMPKDRYDEMINLEKRLGLWGPEYLPSFEGDEEV